MKSLGLNIKQKMISRYLTADQPKNISGRTDINVLLNRVKLKQKTEHRKKLYFSAAASTGIILFGLIIF
jgi:hypothetical protein|tara:strand:- start:133 stop:339 length:207 start_codon:yes stop_codon:yes gene_type:complete